MCWEGVREAVAKASPRLLREQTSEERGLSDVLEPFSQDQEAASLRRMPLCTPNT